MILPFKFSASNGKADYFPLGRINEVERAAESSRMLQKFSTCFLPLLFNEN